MNIIHEETLKIAPGFADASGRLGVYETFRAFMDMAAIHAEELGVGFDAMAKRGLFWLTVKTQVNFIKRPRLADTILLRTWPEAPERVRADRSYCALQNGEPVILGKTEWAVIDVSTKRLVPMKGIFSDELEFSEPPACPDAFARISDDFSEGERIDSYRVRSIDVDVGGHMNNAAYVKALMGCFTNAELSALEIARMEVIFRSPCFEGDTLDVYRRDSDGCIDLRMARGEETIALARITKK